MLQRMQRMRYTLNYSTKAGQEEKLIFGNDMKDESVAEKVRNRNGEGKCGVEVHLRLASAANNCHSFDVGLSPILESWWR